MTKKLKAIDLTHTLSQEIPSWDGSCGFELSVITDYKDCKAPNLFRVQKIKCNNGIGTHMDAPAHVVKNGRTIDELNLKELITDCVVIDVSPKVNADYVIMPDVIHKFEKKHGKIKSNSFVIFYTGWEKYWENKTKYNNNHKFPSIHTSTAKLLLKRNIAGIGTDTLSVDTGEHGFPVHHAILGKDKYLVENVANAKSLPPIGANILVLPLKIKNGTESPIRLIALI